MKMKEKKELNWKDEPVREIIKIPTKFPIGLTMAGDDFKFECQISLEMAGKVIEYIGREHERIAKLK